MTGRRELQAVAWVVLAAVATAALFLASSAQGFLTRQSRQRASDLCALANADRSVLRAVVDAATQPVSAPAGSDPAIVAAYAQSNARTAALRAYSDRLLTPVNCALIVSGDPIPGP